MIRRYVDMPHSIITLAHERRVSSFRELEHCVKILGEVDEHTKESLYREATIFLMPNIAVPGDMEGFGLVCVEAAARGLPVVAAKLEGIQDAVIDGVTGTFFFTEDASDALRAIDMALSEPWDTAAMVAACGERYASSVMASRYTRDVF
jgi:glycosyltransferase involved in cell wall biosynthesis